MLITFDFVTIDYENEIRKMITKTNKAKNKLRLKKKKTIITIIILITIKK